MATLIKSDGSTLEVKPDNGKDFSLKELQSFVGGFIEVVNLPVLGGRIMVVNEEGKLDDLPINLEATKIFGDAHNNHSDVIVGDVLICKTEEVK